MLTCAHKYKEIIMLRMFTKAAGKGRINIARRNLATQVKPELAKTTNNETNKTNVEDKIITDRYNQKTTFAKIITAKKEQTEFRNSRSYGRR